MADFQDADSVTGFDASDLEALGIQTIEGLGKFTPNLEIVTSGATDDEARELLRMFGMPFRRQDAAEAA